MAKKNKIKRKIGDVFLIKVKDGNYSFGIVLEEPLMAFYDFKSKSIVSDINSIIKNPILFKIWVMNHAIELGSWKIIGSIVLDPSLLIKPVFFKQDIITKKLMTYIDGVDSPSSIDECKLLERAAVWDPEHVEDRLFDYYEGIPNKWVESLKLI